MDLLKLFLEQLVLIDSKYQKDSLNKGWDIAFHGTLQQNVELIINGDFDFQGKTDMFPDLNGIRDQEFILLHLEHIVIKFGNKWDTGAHGIMQDPELDTPIFLCVVIRGRSYQYASDKFRKYDSLEFGYDSYLS